MKKQIGDITCSGGDLPHDQPNTAIIGQLTTSRNDRNQESAYFETTVFTKLQEMGQEYQLLFVTHDIWDLLIEIYKSPCKKRSNNYSNRLSCNSTINGCSGSKDLILTEKRTGTVKKRKFQSSYNISRENAEMCCQLHKNFTAFHS